MSISSELNPIELKFAYFFEQKYPWIMAWQYDKTYDHLGFPMLSRQIRIKWWKEFSQSRLNLQQSPSSAKSVSSKADKKEKIAAASAKIKELFGDNSEEVKELFQEFIGQPSHPSTPEDFDPYHQFAPSP